MSRWQKPNWKKSGIGGWQQSAQQWTGSASSSASWRQSGTAQDQAGDQACYDRQAPVKPSQRRTSYPRYKPSNNKHKPAKKRRGKGHSGTAQGWLQESKHEELPLSMRWTFLTDADLDSLGPAWRERMISESAKNFQCKTSWRKERHPERHMRIPYRVSVRGENAPACAEWLIEEMLTAGLDMEDIWSLPVPEENTRRMCS